MRELVPKSKFDWNGILKAQGGTISALNCHRMETLGMTFRLRAQRHLPLAEVVREQFQAVDIPCPMAPHIQMKQMVL